jgi:ABC-type phosphate/phosphonate transport system permease subunit
MVIFRIRRGVGPRGCLSRWAFLIALVALAALLVTPVLAGGHGETSQLEHVVTEKGKSGISLSLAQLYNQQRFLYAVVVTLTMAVLGMVVAQVTELVLKLLGAKRSSTSD